MVFGVLAALVAVACLGLVGIVFELKFRTFRVAIVGLAAGYAIGFVSSFILGYLHISLPPIQYGDAAYASSVWLRPAIGIAGMVTGGIVAIINRQNAA
jgi:hypothetical protein